MAEERKPYRRESEDKRRMALITATLALVSEGGAQAATLRAIARRADVTAGLIRHYFKTKENLIAAAFRHLMTSMTEDSVAALSSAPRDPAARMAAFVDASLRPPVANAQSVIRWAALLQETTRNPMMQTIHIETYEDYRSVIQDLIANLQGDLPEQELRRQAIAVNALIDGLWLAAATMQDAFAKGELIRVGILACGAILGRDLSRYLLLSEPPTS